MEKKRAKKYFTLSTIVICIAATGFYFVVHDKQVREVNYLIKSLKSEDPNIRASAVEELPKYKDKAVGPLSEVLFEDQREEIRISAIEALGNIRTEESAVALSSYLKRTHAFPNEVTRALVDVGTPAVSPLFRTYADSKNEFEKVFILKVFADMMTESSSLDNNEELTNKIKQLYLEAFKNDNSRLVRETSLQFLRLFQSDEDVQDVFKKALNDKDERIREIASEILTPKTRSDPDQERMLRIIDIIAKHYKGHKQFPKTLDELVKAGLIEKGSLLNPWDYPYIYEVARDGNAIELISVGKDGKRGTADDVKIPMWRDGASVEKK